MTTMHVSAGSLSRTGISLSRCPAFETTSSRDWLLSRMNRI